MRLLPLLAGLILPGAALAGEGVPANPAPRDVYLPGSAPVTTCPTIYIPPLVVTVKNERGQVLTTLYPPPRPGREVGSTAGAKFERGTGGRYSVTVSRHWYQPQTVRNIAVQYDRCGPIKPTPVVIRLRPMPNAPTIREFCILNTDDELVVGSWPYFQRYKTFLDAPSSVSREVIWTSSRPDVATVDAAGVLRSVCSREVGRTTITATLKADPLFNSSTVFGRG